MVQTRQSIPITADWSPDEWQNFSTGSPSTTLTELGDTPNITYPWGLSTQNHINLRNFIEGTWTGLTTGYQSSFNHWPGGTANITTGTTTFTSLYTIPIDLTQLGSSSVLCLALPSFPLANINRATSFLDLSADGFVTTCSLAWSASTSTPISGHSSLQWPYSALTGIDLTKVTHVRLRVTATGNCTINMMALRLIGPQWIQTNVDFDNLSKQVRSTIPLTGDPALASVPNNQVVPTLWRSAATPGVDDPRPVDGEIGFLFNTGSMTAGSHESVSLYMRQTDNQWVTQAELQNLTQSGLTGLAQPGLTPGESWVSFTVQWKPTLLIRITNAQHPTDGYQFTSGFTPAANSTYLCVCTLHECKARLQIFAINQTTLSIGFSLYPSLTLDPSLTLYPGSATATLPYPSPFLYPSPTLYPSSVTTGILPYPLFDSDEIPDSFMFARHAGRVGIQTTLTDGDAYLGAMRPRHLMFAEYRSRPLRSLTPVRGARLYAQTPPDTEFFSGWTALGDSGGNIPLLTNDQQRFLSSNSDSTSTRVTITKNSVALPAQGIISNALTPLDDSTSGITDFGQLHISFSLWVPRAAQLAAGILGIAPITAALISDTGNVIPIPLPILTPDQWSSVDIMRPVPRPYPQSGLYQFVLYYNGSVATNWWVDGVSIHQHPMDWSARSVIDDPFHDNYAPWTTFHDALNSDTDGVKFSTMGSDLQIRGQALRQDAIVLSSPKVIPEYATLGRFAWPEDTPPATALPNPVITSTRVARTYTFQGTSSTSVNGIGNYLWSFGDGGFASGPVVTYTYSSIIPVGTQFEAILTVLDTRGQANSVTTLVILP